MKKIVYLTDTHLDEPGPGKHGADAHKNWNVILAELATMNDIDQVIFGGDIGAFSAYPDFFKALSGFETLRISPGNHDISKNIQKYFPKQSLDRESGFYGSEDNENLKWLFLDSSTGDIGNAQMKWLENELAENNPEIILFIHHPILPVETVVDRKYPLGNRNVLKNLLLNYRKKVTVFCGHYHIEDETADGNITQFTTPAISYQIKKGTAKVEGDATYFGFRIIYIEGNNIDTEVVILYPEDY